MDLLQEVGFSIKETGGTYNIKGEDGEMEISVDLLTDGTDNELCYVKIITASHTSLASYSKFHVAFCKKRCSDKKMFILCYDLQESNIPLDMELFGTLVKMKQSLMEEYKASLICSIILVENVAIKMLLNTLFSTMYTPVCPVRLLKTVTDAASFVASSKEKKRKDEAFEVYSEE